MSAYDNPLRNVRVAAPCPANWESMCGNEQVRFCAQCNLNVYNLSGMTRPEAEAFVTRAEGRVCIRFFRRADGSILTQNCPVGWRALKKRVSGVAKAAVSTVMGFVAGLGFNTAFTSIALNESADMIMMRDEPSDMIVVGAMIAEPSLSGQPLILLQGEMMVEEGRSEPVPPPSAEGGWIVGQTIVSPPTVTASRGNRKR